MRSSVFILLALLSSTLSKSTPNQETVKTPIAKVSSGVPYRSQISSAQYRRTRGNYNDSESIETLFIPEDPGQYADILLRVRTLFARVDSEEPQQQVDGVKDAFSQTDDARKRNSSPAEREGDEEKYLPRNPVDGSSRGKNTESNRKDGTVMVKKDNHDADYEGNIDPDEEDLLEAANYGLNAMKELYTVKEPMLYSMGLYLDSDNPARHVAVFNDQTEEARTLAKYGFAVLETITMFRRKFPDSPTDSLLSRRIQSNPLQRGCPNRGVPNCPGASLRYRTSDGSCNNLQHLWWGSAMSTMQRFLPPVYDDRIQSVRRSVTGRPLPSPRQVSTGIHEDRDIPLASVTHMLMQWGQFVDHDLAATGQSRGFNGSIPQCCLRFGSGFQPPEFMHPECLPIAVNFQDRFLGPLGVRCLEFTRSGPAPKENCEFGPREQLTQVTSFLDASAVYSSNALLSDSLRLFRNGLLQYGKLQAQRPQLPKLDFDICKRGSLSTSCFRAGDGRVGEQPALTSLHVAFLRLHNRISTKLAALNAHWNDEKLFQESRRIVGAVLQHITYREFLPIVLGQDVMNIFELTLLKHGYYEGYDPTVDPTIANAFSTAAYRFGHSLVQHSFVRFDSHHRPIFNNVSVHNEFTNPANLETVGSVDRLLLGLINQPAQRRDEHISEELTNHLFQTPNFPFGMDLASINVQRGRDHGVPPYVQWREPCGLSPIKNFDDLDRTMPTATARKFRLIYSSVEDIDLFTAGLAEKSVKGGLVGPTFACIIGQQFNKLRSGDRFWYENSGPETSFTPGQLQQIRRVSLAQVLCTTMDDVETVQPFVFLTHDILKNQRLSCDDPVIGELDLEFWAEGPTELKSRTGFLDKFIRRTTRPPVTTPKSVPLKQDNSATIKTPADKQYNILQNLAPPKASIHQINKIFVKKPIGPPDNYTIVVQNNAINSPVFVNDAIHGSSINVQPSLNHQTQQKPAPQDHLPVPAFLPPPRPIPTVHPLDQANIPRPYLPYAFNDPNNPNPLSQGFQPGYVSRDVLFESYPGTSPRPTLYTYYTNFQRQTTPRPSQDVDAYLVNYMPENHGTIPSSWYQQQTEQLSRPNYSSSEKQQSDNGVGYTSPSEDNSGYQKRPHGPLTDSQGQLNDSGNRYRPGNTYTTRSSIYYDNTESIVNNHHSSMLAHQKPVQADHWTAVSGHQKGPAESNTRRDQSHQSDYIRNPVKINSAHLATSGRPILHDEHAKNPNNRYSSVAHSTPVYKLPQYAYQTHQDSYQSFTRTEPSKIPSAPAVTGAIMSLAGHQIDNIEDRVTSEIPKPLTYRIGNNIVRRPGQYYYERNALHRYTGATGGQNETYNVEQRREVSSSDGSSDQSVIDASVRKQQVISVNGSDTSVDTMNRRRNGSFTEEVEAVTLNNRTNHWLNPREDSSLASAMEVPNIPSDKITTASELPKQMKLRKSAS